MNQPILHWKIIMSFCVVLLFFNLPTTKAQESIYVTNSLQILAAQLDVKAYPNGTFDSEKAFLTLNAEMDKMSDRYSRGLEYQYYWMVAVDVKRNQLPLEESLLRNLNRVGDEFGVPNSTLQKLYRKTIQKM
ncbi:MAG TPA: hypothetical protein ENJ53_08135 [Phaeodactylibacter sp.]|nr:hypothetical protein [Phaeodactylibacter sp.]